MILDVVELSCPLVPKLPEALLVNSSLDSVSGRLNFRENNVPALFELRCLFLAAIAKRNDERSRPLWSERI